MRVSLRTGLGIDLGTADTVVVRPGRGIVLDQPSVMVMGADADRRPGAVGSEAREMMGRLPAGMAHLAAILLIPKMTGPH